MCGALILTFKNQSPAKSLKSRLTFKGFEWNHFFFHPPPLPHARTEEIEEGDICSFLQQLKVLVQCWELPVECIGSDPSGIPYSEGREAALVKH